MPDAGAVTVGYVHDTSVAYSWHQSMIDLIAYDLGHEQRVMRGGWMGVRYGTGGIVVARNMVAERFVNDDRADWLWWVDTDMGFVPDTVDRLLAVADPVERPVVGGLCFMWRETSADGFGGFTTSALPTIFDWVKTADGRQGFTTRNDYERDALIQCSGTGSACILIHRSALEKVHDTYGPTWYDQVPNPADSRPMAEDLSFCARLAACGIPVHIDTSVKTTHLKEVWVGEGHYAA